MLRDLQQIADGNLRVRISLQQFSPFGAFLFESSVEADQSGCNGLTIYNATTLELLCHNLSPFGIIQLLKYQRNESTEK